MQVTLKISEFSLYYILDVPEKASFRRLPFYCCRFVFMIQINFSVDLQLINYVISETMHIVWLKLHNYSCRKRCEIELVIVVKKKSSKFFFFVFCYSAFPCSHLNIHSALKMASYLICCKLRNLFSSSFTLGGTNKFVGKSTDIRGFLTYYLSYTFLLFTEILFLISRNMGKTQSQEKYVSSLSDNSLIKGMSITGLVWYMHLYYN